MICEWCEQPFQPRRGGSPQRFCGPKCRSAFWSGLRRWGERAISAGILTIGDIRNGDPAAAACTLLLRATSATPEGELPSLYSRLVTPRADGRPTCQQNLERAMAKAITLRRRG